MKLSPTYEPKEYEPNIYALWETAGAFSPTGQGKPYTIVMPPPNANGNLHIGHALDMNLKDIMTRFQRMKGRDALFIPGADHAGFETWVVYEKQLAKEGKSRFDFSREGLYGQVWDFVEGQRGNMELQLRALGVSASWDHLVFTLDKKVVDTVYGTFKQLWDDGLVYRGERIVNYCTVHRTSFADIEVEHKTEKSKLWQIAYPALEVIGEIVVATTRPETMLGDTAIAVHPDDERYKKFIGTNVLIPVINREIPVIADEAVDMSFGTGAVKVTPAHDPTDFEIGERHDLPRPQVIGMDGTMTGDIPPQYLGKPALEAREMILRALTSAEALREVKDYEHAVGHCYKCGSVIQPLLKDQWFLKITPLAERAIKALEAGDVTFTPQSKSKLLKQYLENLRDWNLSRQIPWGIPIPAFRNVADPDDWIFNEQVDQAEITVDGRTYARDEDTFDTWFSSGQWPFIVTDHLRQGSELSNRYPTDLMETGTDLIDRWVARMIMLGLYRTGEVPFRHVYLHGMVLDEKGQKMSKSKGNVINPMEMVEGYGSDALRLGIVGARSAAQNQAFSTAKVIAGRNFCNKLWNIARFIEDKVGDDYSHHAPKPASPADHWVIRQLGQASADITKLLGSYRFAEASEVVYHTIWDDVADWYVESSKLGADPSMLVYVLESCLKLAHPFAPFVTETIWQTLKWEDTLLIRAAWPKAHKFDEAQAEEFDQLQKLITETRFVASEMPGGKQTLVYKADKLIADNAELIKLLARLKEVARVDAPEGLRLAVPQREAWLAIDADILYEHQTKLEGRLADTRTQIERLEKRLATPSYINNAPKAIVEDTRKQLGEQKHLEERLVKELASL